MSEGVVLFAVVLVGLSVLGAVIRVLALRAYYRHIANWARDHDWVFRRGGKNVNWEYRLPHGANKSVRFQVEGTIAQRRFTVGRVDHVWGKDVVGPTETVVRQRVHLTVIVLHLTNSYPPAEVEEREGWAAGAGRSFGTIGHPRFDELFVVHTEVPGGPRSVVPPALAEAHVRREVPVWAVRGRELVCTVLGGGPARIRNERRAEAVRSLGARTIDEELAAAMRIADLLGVR